MTRLLQLNLSTLFSISALLLNKLIRLNTVFIVSALMLVSLFPSVALAGEYSVFGPRIYVRSNGAPFVETDIISTIPADSYLLKIQNGGLTDIGDFDRVSSSVITLNNDNILSPNELNQQVDYIEKAVTLSQLNELAVKVKGKPGSALIINIVGVDNDMPTISANITPLPNTSGWHNSNVTVTFNCSDGLSGISTCSNPITLSTEGKNQVITGEAVDNAGNTVTTSVILNIDKTLPAVSITSPIDGALLSESLQTVLGQVTDQNTGITATLNDMDVTLLANGSLSQNINLLEGLNTLTLSARDIAGNLSQHSISVSVQLNQPPIAASTQVSLDEDTSVNVLLSATDPNGDILTYQTINQPLNGVLTGIAPNLFYTPNGNFNGVDRLSFKVNDGLLDSNIATVNVTVNAVNDAPVALTQTLQLNEDDSLLVTLTGNDIDGDTLTYQIVTNPLQGVITGTAPNLTYTPNADYFGIDEFSFQVNDGELNSSSGTILLNIAAVNDAPHNNTLTITVDENSFISIELPGIDIDSDTLSYQQTTSAQNGTITGVPPSIQYTPVIDYFGTDQFEYQVSDGELNGLIMVNVVINEEVDSLVFDSAPITYALKSVQYDYQVEVSGGSEPSNQFSLTVAPQGMFINADSGLITWTPDDSGQFDVEIYAINGGQSIKQSFTIIVADPEPSYVGNDFWITFSNNISGSNKHYYINISGQQSGVGLIVVPSLNFSLPFVVNENEVTNIDVLTKIKELTDVWIQPGTSIHITSDVPVVVYGMNYLTYSTDGFLALPTKSLGTEYVVADYIRGQIDVIATEDETIFNVNLPRTIKGTFEPAIKEVLLNKGESFTYLLYLSSDSFSGAVVHSNKPVAVFSGNMCINIPHGGYLACDHLVEQLVPSNQLGTRYASMPLATRTMGDTFKVIATKDNTVVRRNDVPIYSLNKGEFWENRIDEPSIISANHPIQVVQYSNSKTFDNTVDNMADPFMMLLTPVEQYLKVYTFATPPSGYSLNFINVVIPQSGISSFFLDGQPVDATLFVKIHDSNLWGAQIPIEIGTHQTVSDVPFGLSIYGFDIWGSYGYQGGMKLARMSSEVIVSLQNNIETEFLGNESCMSVVVTDQSIPVIGARVDFHVRGANTKDAYLFTDDYGQVEYCYSGLTMGEDSISATVKKSTKVTTINWQQSSSSSGNNTPTIISLPEIQAPSDKLYRYQVVANDVDEGDGDVLTYSLLNAPTGMLINQVGLIQWIPESSQLGTHLINVNVVDITGNEVSQQYELYVTQSNRAPIIVSKPDHITAYIGKWIHAPYVVIDEPDGDYFKFDILNPDRIIFGIGSSGSISVYGSNEFLGDYIQEFKVTDIEGNATYFEIPITTKLNHLPELSIEPADQAKVGQSYSSQIQFTDIDGDILNYSWNSNTLGMNINTETGQIDWTPTVNDIGEHTIKVRVKDAIDVVYFTYKLTVYPYDQPLEANITITPEVILQGQPVSILIGSTGATGNITYTLSINGIEQTLINRQTIYTDTYETGSYELIVTANDGVDSDQITHYFSVTDGLDITAPIAEISSPTNGDSITSLTEVIANISDNNLDHYTLRLVEVSNPENSWVVAEGWKNVFNTSIYTFDPSLLMNGQYYLYLTVVDSNGNESTDSSTIIVEGDLKVGNFTYTVEDFTIPMSGIPITVSRTYDSRRKHELLDFGYGWSLSYQNTKLEESRRVGSGWSLNKYTSGFQQTTVDYCIEPLGSPIVTVTLPNGNVESFEVKASPHCSLYVPILEVHTVFSPIGDTQSTLELQNSAQVRLINNQLEILGSNQAYDPDLYVLTTRTGFQYYIDQSIGVQKIIDPNGNTITYSDTGIAHSDGTSITFDRDSLGRISYIKAPLSGNYTYNYSNTGDLINTRNKIGTTGIYDYNYQHGLTDIVDGLGQQVIKNIYDDDGRLIAQENDQGVTTHFNHDLIGRQSVITDKLGNASLYYYDDEGNVTSMVDALGGTTQFTYDTNGNQLSQTDANNHTTTATYNSNNDLLTQTDALGHTTTFTYNLRGQELTIEDAKGNPFNNTYDSVGNLLTITDPLGHMSGNNINAKGLPELVRNALNFETLYSYDETGNKLSQTDALGHVTQYTYDANGNVLTNGVQRTVNGLVQTDSITNTYDFTNNLINVRDAKGKKSTLKYDLNGRKTADKTPLGYTTTYSYDVYGRLTSTTYADNSTETSDYDANGNKISDTDQNGQVTVYTYDALNRLVKTTLSDGSYTQTDYDAVGNVTAETDGLGNQTTHNYDAANKRILTRNALGHESTFVYDVNDNLISQTDANNATTEYVYDALDRKIKTLYADSSFTEISYDALGQIINKTDQKGITTHYTYDALGRLVNVTDALNNMTSYSYDEVGNKTTQTDAENRITTWSYDANGQDIERILPLGQAETKLYDNDQRLTLTDDFKGQSTHLLLSGTGVITRKQFANGKNQYYTYDSNENRITTSGQYGDENWAYDTRNRLTSNTKANGDVLEYQYDAAGNKTSLTITPNIGAASTINYSYDALNRLASVTDDNSETTHYSYDAVGNRASVSYPNGNTTRYDYDSLNRLIRQSTTDSSDTLIQDYQYTLDASGHRTQITELSGRNTDYVYDDLYRLKTEIITDPNNDDYTASYQYDAVGNRTQSIINGVTTQYTYDDNDRLTQQGGETYSYDDQGNTISKTIDGETNTYSYDEKNLLSSASITSNGITTETSYQYNIDGIRTNKTENGTATDYLIDQNRDYAQVLKETDQSTSISTDYLYGDDLIRQSQNNTNEKYYLYDGLGSTRVLTDETGTITDTYGYEAFGTLNYQTGTTPNNYLFTGEQFDLTLNQQYLRARYYDPAIGRFTQQDTYLGLEDKPLTLNKYLYADGNPVGNIDPTGNMSIGSVMSGISGTLRLATISTPQVLNLGFSATRGAVRAGSIACIGHMVSSIVGAELPNAIANNQRSGCEMNQMRVQLQQGYAKTIGKVAHATPNPGVTTNHVRAKLKQLYYARDEGGWFPKALDKWMYDSISILSADLSRFPPSGVSMGGNILRESTGYRGKSYRIDIENLRGHNLMQ